MTHPLPIPGKARRGAGVWGSCGSAGTSPSRQRIAMRARRRGFTLVELLVVIAIISMLVGLLIVGVQQAIPAVKRARIRSEITNLEVSFGTYRDKFGAFPPCAAVLSPTKPTSPTREDMIMQHLAKAFPRCTAFPNYAALRDFIYKTYTGANGAKLDLNNLDPAEALVFWLGGLPDAGGSKKLQGFSADVENPFRVGGSRTASFFDFDETRLRDNDNDGWWEYCPKTDEEGTAPYAYFDYRAYMRPGALNPVQVPLPSYPDIASKRPLPSTLFGFAVPCAASPPAGQQPVAWVNPKTFQIICGGLDGSYGYKLNAKMAREKLRLYPDNENNGYGDEGMDNLTNFSDRALEDAIP